VTVRAAENDDIEEVACLPRCIHYDTQWPMWHL